MEAPSTNTYCNPMSLSYCFREEDGGKVVFREAADPSLVLHEGRYWLFPSKCRGYYHSTDLVNWTHVESSALPVEDYAPDVRVINGELHFTASHGIYRSTDPARDAWVKVGELPFPCGDPNLLQDEDGRLFDVLTLRQRDCGRGFASPASVDIADANDRDSRAVGRALAQAPCCRRAIKRTQG